MNLPTKSPPVVLACLLLIALIISSVPLYDLKLLVASNPRSPIDLLSQTGQSAASPYTALSTIWRTRLPEDQSLQLLSLFLWALGFACLYRLVRNLSSPRSTAYAVLTAGIFPSLDPFLGWSPFYTWLFMLTALSALLLWWLLSSRHRPARILILPLYLLMMVLLIGSCPTLWFLLIPHLFFTLAYGRNKIAKWLTFASLAVIGLVFSPANSLIAPDSVWLNTVNRISAHPPGILFVLCVLAGAGLIASALDLRSVRRRTKALFFLLWLAVCTFQAIQTPIGSLLALPLLVVPLSISLGYGLMLALPRAAAFAAIFAVLIPLAASVAPTLDPLQQELLPRYIAGTPIVVSLDTVRDEPFVLSSLQSLSPLYYVIDDHTLIGTHDNVVSVGDAALDWLRNAPAVWLIDGGNGKLSDALTATLSASKQPVFSKTADRTNLAFYAIRPTRDPIFAMGALTLLDFNVASSVPAGSMLQLISWWSSSTATTENYEVKATLIDASGNPKASDEGLVAESFTGSWTIGSLHLDRRSIPIPKDVPAGQYNLILTLHGTVKDTRDVPFSNPDGGSLGPYGYLTTITVQP